MDSKKKELKRDIVTADVLKWLRNRQRLEKTVGEKKDECPRGPLFRLFLPVQSQASPPGRRLLLHPVLSTCFPSLSPPAVLLLSTSSVLYGTQLLSHIYEDWCRS